MYGRAFAMVRKSAQVTALDLTRVRDRVVLAVVGWVVWVVGWGVWGLEVVGVRRREGLDFERWEGSQEAL
ncbi:FAD/NAD(P)-binding domain [Teratosphaeria destructans]|uniref:FAD/NAD(P)-binding domain n=1 Tax=Teratosphaeria destructans TaxID=418781 RepID=A0A9W7SI49_9PEZI|nr:FAD/NAD(P)-binding domain [Teratosphaeria destructans]